MIAAVVEKGAGIDVHKKFLKVCVMIGALSEEPRLRFAEWNAAIVPWKNSGSG
jgi:hypothetical protein